jgi:focal adhesion kinase 1
LIIGSNKLLFNVAYFYFIDSNQTFFQFRLQLRIRYLSSDLNEVKFKDPITFNYYYEQIKNDFIQFIAPNITDTDLAPSLLDLGCLEIRRSFQNMNPNVLDKKINYDYLEKDVGLKRFFPDIVLQQKVEFFIF